MTLVFTNSKSSKIKITKNLMEWYNLHHRNFPWRVNPYDISAGQKPIAYHVWISEIMLQQTVTTTVIPYFINFINRWPNIPSLAKEETGEILKAWAGLGYYSRARNLSLCSKILLQDYCAELPEDEETLRKLPGIGHYTAAAISAIGFNKPCVVVDANVERVITRLFALEKPLPQLKNTIPSFVKNLLPSNRFGDFAQAMMDFGSQVCTPKKPSCFSCPLRKNCQAHKLSKAEELPYRLPKKKKPIRYGAVFIAKRKKDGAILLRKRSESGLLGGMTEFLGSNWIPQNETKKEIGIELAPFAADWRSCGSIQHIFSHFLLDLKVYSAEIESLSPCKLGSSFWSNDPLKEALPSVMKKALSFAFPTSDYTE